MTEGVQRDYKEDHPECLFYSGTERYRNQDYEEASIFWEKLTAIDVNPEYNELKVNAHNNLGYLKFHGLIPKASPSKALEHWHQAVSLGQLESDYHLCYAYADKEYSTYNSSKAIGHCKRAWAIYNNTNPKTKSDTQILQDIEGYLRSLGINS